MKQRYKIAVTSVVVASSIGIVWWVWGRRPVQTPDTVQTSDTIKMEGPEPEERANLVTMTNGKMTNEKMTNGKKDADEDDQLDIPITTASMKASTLKATQSEPSGIVNLMDYISSVEIVLEHDRDSDAKALVLQIVDTLSQLLSSGADAHGDQSNHPMNHLNHNHLARAFEFRAGLFLSLERYAEARTDAETACRLCPTSAYAYNTLGYARMYLKDQIGAKNAFQRCVSTSNSTQQLQITDSTKLSNARDITSNTTVTLSRHTKNTKNTDTTPSGAPGCGGSNTTPNALRLYSIRRRRFYSPPSPAQLLSALTVRLAEKTEKKKETMVYGVRSS